jgi:ankyrin repeat protein
VPELRVLLQEYQARGRLHEALERLCLSGKGVHHSLLFACLDKFQIEEPMRLATTRLLIEEFNANSRAVQKRADYLVLPLHAAASHGLLSIVKLYISECGVPVDQPTSGKQVLTPLHCAAMCEFAHDAEDEEKMVRTVAFLAEEHGASLTQQTDRGLTAAQVAGRRGKTRVASYLRRMERDQAKMVELTAGEDATKAAEAAEEAANELLAELEAEEAAIRGGGGGGGKMSKKSGKGKGKKKM